MSGRWWGGPLDAERLARAAVGEAREAAAQLARARGLDVEVTTSPALVSGAFAAIEHLRIYGEPARPWGPMSGFFRTRDGWVRTHANYPHHAAAITRALGANDWESLAAAVAHRTAAEIEEAVTAERGIAVAVRSLEEWAAHPQARATADEPWSTVEVRGERPALGRGRAPMAGVRVLDLSRVIAGPVCTQLLACLGADVLRIDPPDRPELQDQFLSNGMGKRSAVADLGAAPEALGSLLDGADVLMLGYRPGSLARFGLEPEQLAESHPRLVVASLSAWGETGPWRRRPGFDSIVQAATGIARVCAADASPGALAVQALDHSTGCVLAAEIMRLLAAGRAGTVRASLLGAARTLIGYGTRSDASGETVCCPEPELVRVPWANGEAMLPPAPLALDGVALAAPIGRYGGAQLRWDERPSDPR